MRIRIIAVAVARDDRLTPRELVDVFQSDGLRLLPGVGLCKAYKALLVQAAKFGVGPALWGLGEQIEMTDCCVAVLVE